MYITGGKSEVFSGRKIPVAIDSNLWWEFVVDHQIESTVKWPGKAKKFVIKEKVLIGDSNYLDVNWYESEVRL